MDTSLFDYALPADRIAQRPMEPRDHAKLLALNRHDDEIADRHIFDLPDLLQPGDLLVFNDTKVFKARLKFSAKGGDGEILLLRPQDARWLAIGRPSKKLQQGSVIALDHHTTVTVVDRQNDGTIVLDFGRTADEVMALADRMGEVPLPPYITMPVKNENDYQTMYARAVGSIAAPTAGFHFTPELFDRLAARGIQTAFVTLHVGLGTFRPMKSATLEEHVMHEEWFDVPDETRLAIAGTKRRGGRVIAVGTTTVRALESVAMTEGARGAPLQNFTNLFITPGFEFKIVDGLVTNFHLPKSTLLVLVSAFADREKILRAYAHAIASDYRFYSFGDAMLILP